MQLYPSAIISKDKPTDPFKQLSLFFDKDEKQWISIPKNQLNEKEMTLLGMLYEYAESDLSLPSFHPSAQSWYDFLFSDGSLPTSLSSSEIRFIHFQVEDALLERSELESALSGFFSEKVIFLWEHGNKGIVIEEKNFTSLMDKEFVSMAETLEADFFTKVFFYTGKYHEVTNGLPHSFNQEKEYFDFGRKYLNNENIYTFEKVFPSYLAHDLPEKFKKELNNNITQLFRDEPEMFSTIKVFLENNLNASMTAKGLYIHRNTLQYRIDKFTEKTGIHLKDFYGAFTVFLACLLIDLERTK